MALQRTSEVTTGGFGRLLEQLDRGALEPILDGRIGGLRVLFGAGCLQRLGQLVLELHGRKALLVTDAGVVRSGHAERAIESLRRAGVEPCVYDGVEANPTTRHAAEGVRVASDAGSDCIVGLGGGSAMDCAKAVNFLLTNGGKMEDYWGSGKATREMLPSVGIATTAGTGSEAQSYALISQEQTRVKMACGDPKARFHVALLDPDLLDSVPAAVAAATGIDAIGHAVEGHVSRPANPDSRAYSLAAWRLLEPSYTQALAERAEPLARGRMLVGAHLAGAAIERSMLGAAHACANPLTARFGVTHGIAVAVMLPHVVRFNSEGSTGSEVAERYAELLDGPSEAAGDKLAERLIRLRTAVGLPQRLRDCGVDLDSLSGLAGEAATQWTAGHNPRPVGQKELLELYEAAY